MGTGHAAVFVGSTHVLSNSGKRCESCLRSTAKPILRACHPHSTAAAALEIEEACGAGSQVKLNVGLGSPAVLGPPSLINSGPVGAVFSFIYFLKIKISKIYVRFEIFQKYPPVAPHRATGSKCNFFSSNLQRCP